MLSVIILNGSEELREEKNFVLDYVMGLKNIWDFHVCKADEPTDVPLILLLVARLVIKLFGRTAWALSW